MSKSIYEKHGNMRIYAGFGVCLLLLLVKSFGIQIPDIVIGLCALGLVPYIIINALIIEHLEKKYGFGNND